MLTVFVMLSVHGTVPQCVQVFSKCLNRCSGLISSPLEYRICLVCVSSLSDLLENWEKLTVKQDGDAIRRLIGTIGVSSPLSSLRKAFISVRDAEEESVSTLEWGMNARCRSDPFLWPRRFAVRSSPCDTLRSKSSALSKVSG